MSTVVIVPGLHDSGPGHWQTQWQQRLPGAVRVEQARWDRADLQRWSDQVAATVEALRGDVWLVAHSFGCLASVHALAQVGARVRGLFLVAPADPDKFDIGDRLPLGRLPVQGMIVGSTSDPWLRWEKVKRWASRWDLPLLNAGDVGHINVESGHGEWREGWEWFRQFQRFGHDYGFYHLFHGESVGPRELPLPPPAVFRAESFRVVY
jgi:predicted alpha/beta hydrolase family esterase